MNGKKYRLHGKPARTENVTKGENVDFATRKTANQNMLVFMVQEIKFSDRVYIEAADSYLGEKTELFKYSIAAISSLLLLTVLIISFTLVKFQVVAPIERITRFIMKPDKQDKEVLDLFIDEILRKAERKQRRIDEIVRKQLDIRYERGKRQRFQPLDEKDKAELEYLTSEINEIEQLNVIYS